MFRDLDNRWLGGVCGGIGKRFDLPTALVRLLFCASVLFFGVGVIPAAVVYVVLWVILKSEPTAGQALRADNSARLLALFVFTMGCASTALAQCPACKTYHPPFSKDNPAQKKAERAAELGLAGHSIPGFPLIIGSYAEGCGQSQASPRRAIEIACYWGELEPERIGYAKGRDGFWYSVVGYSKEPFPRRPMHYPDTQRPHVKPLSPSNPYRRPDRPLSPSNPYRARVDLAPGESASGIRR